MTYKIVVGDGKYTVINNNGVMEIWRYNSPLGGEYQYSGLVLALVQRVEELERENAQLLEATKEAQHLIDLANHQITGRNFCEIESKAEVIGDATASEAKP